MFGFDKINEATGFANNDKFANDAEVMEYFTFQNMKEMFGEDADIDQETLDEMAAEVVDNGWHMER